MDLKAVVPHVFKVSPQAVKSVSVSPDSSGAPVMLVPVPGEPGRNGIDGADGVDGKSAYQLAVEDGFSGTESAWLASLKGADGTDGTDGTDGKSAYQLALDGGYVGTEAQWLQSLHGEDGTDGTDGVDGSDGESAYQVAVDAGFSGTEADWLASLKGEKGDTGDGSMYEMRGAGFPEGVVTADPGTYYTDTAGTAGAWRWLKTSGSGSTGWTVVYGDTGWRILVNGGTPLAGVTTSGTNPTAGRFRVRRVNMNVYWSFDDLQWSAATTWGLPLDRGFQIEADNATYPGAYYNLSSGASPIRSDTASPRLSIPAAGARIRDLRTYPARPEWPTVLPGNPG